MGFIFYINSVAYVSHLSVAHFRDKYIKLQTVIEYNKLATVGIDCLLYSNDIVLITDTHGKMEKLGK